MIDKIIRIPFCKVKLIVLKIPTFLKYEIGFDKITIYFILNLIVNSTKQLKHLFK